MSKQMELFVPPKPKKKPLPKLRQRPRASDDKAWIFSFVAPSEKEWQEFQREMEEVRA